MTPLVVMLAAGCVPEETVRWSQDGTVGVYCDDDKVGLINEQSGQTVVLDEGDIEPWADISRDGTMVCYPIARQFTAFEAARAVLPPETVSTIETAAAGVLQRLEAGKSYEESMQPLEDEEGLKDWVKKYIWDGWKDKYNLPESAKAESVDLSELVLCSVANPQQKETLVRSIELLGFCRFSPDGTKIGYVKCGADLVFNKIYILPLTDKQVCLVDDDAGIFFDWSDDGTTMCYTKSENGDADGDGVVLGTLCERRVADDKGNLLAGMEEGAVVCTAERSELAGILYGGWCNKVEYVPGGRIFFSSAKLTIPASKLEEAKWSLFCYDALTGAVGQVLPEGEVFSAIDMALFSVSPDGTKVLIPNGTKRVLVYEPAKREFTTITGDDETEKDDVPEMMPSWKGNDAVCCKFTKEGTDETAVGVFNLKGELLRQLTPETAP